MRAALRIAAVVGALLAAAGPAQAATVRVEPDPDFGCSTRFVYAAASGELNEVHVGGLIAEIPNPVPIGPFCEGPVELVTISEQYHPLHAGTGCTQLTSRSAACETLPFFTPPSLRSTSFSLGDRDDLLTIAPGSLPGGSIDAGAGTDILDVAQGAADEVTCGPGVDRVAADPFDAVAADCELVNP